MKQILLIALGLSVALFADMSRTGSIVTDSETHLQWQDDAIGSKMSWISALTHCEDLTLGGNSDWRLPNLNELTSIVDDSKVNPAIYSTFEMTEPYNYWSSTGNVQKTSEAWSVNFYYGSQGYGLRGGDLYVRCVRDAQ